MDLTEPLVQLIAGIAQNLGANVLTEVSGKVRQAILGKPAEHALRRAYHQAVEAFVSSLPGTAENYRDVIEAFFSDHYVTVEFASLLTPSSDGELDLEVLRQRFEELGFDSTTMPSFSFENALQALVKAFAYAAAEDPELRSILSFQGIQRIQVQLATLIGQHEGSNSQVADLIELLIKQQQVVEATTPPAQKVSATRQYRYPSQQFVRYVSLAADGEVPEPVVQLFRALAMTAENWIEESSDASEIVLSAEDFVPVMEILARIGQRIPKEGNQPPSVIMRAIASELTTEVQNTLRLHRNNVPRLEAPIALQMKQGGIPYVVLGITPEFSGLIEVVRATLHPTPAVVPPRVQHEIHFESLEDVEDVLSSIQRIATLAGADEEKLTNLLIEEMMARAWKKALAVSGVEDVPKTPNQGLGQSLPASNPSGKRAIQGFRPRSKPQRTKVERKRAARKRKSR